MNIFFFQIRLNLILSLVNYDLYNGNEDSLPSLYRMVNFIILNKIRTFDLNLKFLLLWEFY